MATLLNVLPAWLREWVRVYIVPLLKVEVRRLLWILFRGSLDTVLIASIPVTVFFGSHAVWEGRYALDVAHQEQVAQWAQVSAAIALLEDVPPATPLVLWYKEGGLQAQNPVNCEGIMGLHSAVTSGQMPCFSPGPIDAEEVARQLRLGAAVFKEHCPEVHYDTTDPEVLKRCYLYYNAGRNTLLTPDRSGYVMNGYDAAHQNMAHRSETGKIVILEALGAWPVHLIIQTQMAQTSPRAASLLLPPALTIMEVKDRVWKEWVRREATPPENVPSNPCREPVVGDCFIAPHTDGEADLRLAFTPLAASIQRGSELTCSYLPGIDLEPAEAAIVQAPVSGELMRYADQWGHLALRVENDEWTIWLSGLRSYTAQPGPVEAGESVGAIGGPGSATPVLHLAIYDKSSGGFVDPVALLPEGNCPAAYQPSLNQDGSNKEGTMNLLALLAFIPAVLGIVWAIWLFFKKDILAKGPIQVITYFLGVIIALFFIGWLVDAFLPQWVAQRLTTAQQSNEIDTIEQISRDILNESLGTPPATAVFVPQPTTPPGQPQPTVSPQPTPGNAEISPVTTLNSGEQVHIVQEGENLYRVSLQYEGVSWPEIAERNNIQSPYEIQAGQQLIIPAP